MTTTAPTSLRGHVSNDYYGQILDDLTADLPAELVWPLSVQTFAAMRRESHIAAALNGYTLQLRRAQWQLDGRGCRPEVTRLVADDMGLLPAGDEPSGAARTRGVSWHQHLRSALLYLPYGHMGFEMLADTTSGQARLAGLADRMPHTISTIHFDPQSGDLRGITQDAGSLAVDSPQIAADRLVWYCHEREGASWQGASILKPIFPAYVVKREMLRVHALANRRWGMGVPVMEALPGSNPTPAQMSEAMQLAAAARAGEQAGAATPPGFAMKILGITGSVPDTLGFLRFLNQEISSGLLMPHMDLGSTPNGSRALGESFTSSWLLALGTLAEEICDVATRQIAARLVEWNFGPDEPVPTVVVSGIGEQREVTAESLKMLLDSGAMAADPALEAWVRREYRLPEKDPDVEPAKTATKGAPGQPKPTDDTTPVEPDPEQVAAAARSRSSRRRPAKQPALFGDDDDPAATAARIQAEWLAEKSRLLKRWPKTAAPMVDELADQARAAVEAGELALLGELQVSAGVIAAVAVPLRKSSTDLARLAAAGVVQEAAGQGVDVVAPDVTGSDRIVQHADAVARIIAAGYASGAARIGLQLAGVSPAEVKTVIGGHLTDLGTSESGLVGDNIGALLSAAQHAGRLRVLEEHPADAYQAVEVNDRSRCARCAEAAGRRYLTLEAALVDYPVSGLRSCLGRDRCRGHLRPIWN